MTSTKQYYGIKFPFTDNNVKGFFIDLNDKPEDKIASEILHTILTTKGTRIRRPDFGTRLIDFIFEPSDELTWDKVEAEVKSAVQRFVPKTVLNNIEIYVDENNDSAIFLDLDYSVTRGLHIVNNRMVVKL